MVESKSRIGIVVQARMGSSRLPGKVLAPLAGQPMIGRVIERLSQCQHADLVIMATSNESGDKPLVDWARSSGVTLFLGSERDVLDRFYRCALDFDLDVVVRATGDNPFVDPEEGDRLIAHFLNNQLDYASMAVDPNDGYPGGLSLEIFSFDTLKRSWKCGLESHHREHVNEYVLENFELFQTGNIASPPEKTAPDLSFTVDTEKELTLADSIYRNFVQHAPNKILPLDWAICYMRKNGFSEDKL